MGQEDKITNNNETLNTAVQKMGLDFIRRRPLLAVEEAEEVGEKESMFLTVSTGAERMKGGIGIMFDDLRLIQVKSVPS